MAYEDLPPELRAQIEADEKSDAAQFEWVTVRNFAKARKIEPQHVYYYIRNGKIEQTHCPCCGTKVINLKQATELFDTIAAKAQSRRSGVSL